jgi:hypothetical protein
MSVARVWEGGSQRPQTAQSRDASLEQRLRDFLRGGGDWERSRTSIPGVFVVKLPSRGPRGAELTLEINPVDGQGQPRKKRGYMVLRARRLRAQGPHAIPPLDGGREGHSGKGREGRRG